MSADAVIAAARLVRYKTKALREALKAYDAAESARLAKAERDRTCAHPNATRVARSNAGGYDGPAYDRYWYDCACPDCGKHWTQDQ